MDNFSQLATIISPIISVIAIISALYIARNSSRDAKRQVKAIYNLMDVFVAAHNLDIAETQEKYRQELENINADIGKLEEKINTHNSGTQMGSFIQKLGGSQKLKERDKQLNDLKIRRRKVEANLLLIKDYLEKATKKHE